MNQDVKKKKIPVETFSRIVGYFQPTNQWNKGKLSEFADRKPLSLMKLQKFVKEYDK